MEIRLEEVTKYYYDQGKSTKGVEGISVSFKTDGSFVVITGESGSGKSTLIKILTGIDDFDEGEIYFDNKPLSGLKEEERHSLYSRYISFVFQDYNLVESMSAEDNIVLALLKHGLFIKEAKKKARSALEEVGLKAQRKMKTSRLSGGERQRVAIARSLALETPVIIFDEPTGNLDPTTSKEIVEIIHRVSKGRLIVYVTHDNELVKNVATRHIELSDGHVVSDVSLKPSEDIGASNEQKEAKMGFSSYLYAAKSFALSRVGRFFSTCLILLVSTFMLFSISASASFSFVSSTNPSLWDYPNNGKTYLYSSLGNRVDVRKKSITQSYDSLEGLKEDEDYFSDAGRLLDDASFSLYPAKEFEACDKYSVNETNDYRTFDEQYDLLNTVHATISMFAPSAKEIECSYKAKGNAPEGYSPVKLYIYDGGYFSDSKLGKAVINNLPLSPLGQPAYLTLDSSVFEKASLTEVIDQKSKEFLLTSPKVWVDEVIVTGGKDYWEYDAVIVCNNSVLKAARSLAKTTFEERLIKERSVTVSSKQDIFDYYSFFSSPLYINRPSSITLISEAGNVYQNRFGRGSAFYSRFDDNTIYLKEDYPGDPLKASLVWNDIRFNIGELIRQDASIGVSTYVPDSTTGENDYDAFIVSPNLIMNYCLENGGFDSFYFKTESLAESQAKAFQSEGLDSAFYEAHDRNKQHYEVIDFSSASLTTKLISFLLLIVLLGGLSLVSFIIRLILTKFYYRKDFDQFVLNWIGYGKKDIFFVNLLQFFAIELLACVVVYPLMFVLYPQYWTVFTIFPYVFILGFLLNFGFAVSLSLPKATRKKVRKND